MKQTRLWIAVAALGMATLPAVSSHAAPKKPAVKKTAKKPVAKGGSKAGLIALKISLPAPAFIGTPKNVADSPTLEKPTGKPRAAFYVPKGTVLLSKGKEVTSSDTAPIIGELNLVTDGNKEATEGSYVELGPFKQWVQVDLGRAAAINAIVLWHHHSEAAVYHGVVAQVSDDKDFVSGVKTIFNNDFENGHGLGRGKDKEYFEFAEGKLINAKGVKGRYVRLYSNGSTSDVNRYTEIEVYGK